MKKISKVSIIAHFGGQENFRDGQTIKSKILYEELLNAANWKIMKVDTYYKNKKPFKLLLEIIISILCTKNIIVLLSGNGMKFYFPILYFFANVFNKKIYHNVIGGNLNQYVIKYPKFKKYLNSFCVNWVETESLKEKLEKQGIINCEVIPNFKRLDIENTNFIRKDFKEPYSFCTFSRVMKEKGIEDAIYAVETINAELGRTICTLDIYGKVDEGYERKFNEIIKNTTEAIKYRGMVPYNKSVEMIRDYYALLFPTYWAGEGFPGTIIDAFSAGIPVIATDWNCNSEIIENKKNGVLYPNNEIKTLKEAIEWIIGQKHEIYKLKIDCIKTAELYQPEPYIKQIVNKIIEK